MNIAYRPDIDGLRAIAVLLVVLYHAGVPAFPGGFVGVDVFFVISGYLITAIIHGEMRAGDFSFAKFYERRARRLFPALFVVLAACLVIGYFTAIPGEYVLIAESAVTTLFFVSNLFFWSVSGYFAPEVEHTALLHTWSLGVEEQFYLLFPLILLVLFRYARKYLRLALVGMAVVSFIACVIVTDTDAKMAFYLTPFRIWELLAGGLLALYFTEREIPRPLAIACGIAGLAAIVNAAMTYTAATAFPGSAALLPSAGAALIIFAGRDAGSPVTRALSWPPLVYTGLISYSLYLWHRPMLTYIDSAVVAIAISFVLSALSLHVIERPVRDRTRFRGIWPLATAHAGVIVAAVVAIVLSAGFPARVPDGALSTVQTFADQPAFPEPCLDYDAELTGAFCRFGPDDAMPSYAIWGDSHARVLAGAITDVAMDAGYTGQVIVGSGCPPLVGIVQRARQQCTQRNLDALEYLTASPGIELVVLIGRWALYAEGTRYGDKQADEVILEAPGSRNDSIAGNHALFRSSLATTVERLIEAGKRVVVLSQIPEIATHPRTLSQARMQGRMMSIELTRDEYLARNRRVLDTLSELESGYDRVSVIHPYRVLCDAASCRVEDDGMVIYYDHHHLTHEGTRLLSPLFVPLFPPKERTS